MSPEQKATKLFSVAEELEHVCRLLTLGLLATEAMADGTGAAVHALLSEVATKLDHQADIIRSAR